MRRCPPATLIRHTRTAVAAVGLGLACLAATVGTASAAPFEEPVSVTATTPAAVSSGVPFQLEVAVAAEPGALDIAAQPLRLRVKFEPECGGSFAGTDGPVAIDRVLPSPSPGAAYAQTVTASETLGPLGPETVCAFLEDGQERQFATDTEAELTVGSGGPAAGGGGTAGQRCTVATATLKRLKRSLKKLDRRIHKLRVRIKHTGAAKKRRAEVHHLSKLRRQRHKLAHRKRRAAHLVSVNCGSGG